MPHIIGSSHGGIALNPSEGMHMSGESLLVVLLVGVIAGWLARQIVRGTGFGLIGDLLVGIIGAFIGGWLLPRVGIHIGVGLIAAIFNATVTAIVLLPVVGLVRGGHSFRGGLRCWVQPRPCLQRRHRLNRRDHHPDAVSYLSPSPHVVNLGEP